MQIHEPLQVGIAFLPHEWLDEVGLATFEVKRIFSALDQGEGEVLFAEFETALRQMRGLPRAADVVINLYETRSILLRVMRMESSIEESMEKIRLFADGPDEATY